MPTTSTAAHHAARVLIHRWFAYLQRGDGGEAALLELLEEDAWVTSTFGTGQGHAGILKLLAARPGGERNAYDVLTFESRAEAGVNHVTLNIAHQLGPLAGPLEVRRLHCQFELREYAGRLPRIARIVASPLGAAEVDHGGFKDQYPTHRVRSAFHAWLLLNELKAAEPVPFLDLLAPDGLALQLGARSIHSVDEFEAWWRQDAHTHASAHRVDQFTVESPGDDKYLLRARVHWAAPGIGGLNEHRWQLRESRERYPRIETLEIAELPPLR